MGTHYQNCLPSMHRVIQHGDHELHFKDGGLKTEIEIKDQLGYFDELLKELDILTRSKFTSLSEKRRFEEIAKIILNLDVQDQG
jgi:hypothetical protein